VADDYASLEGRTFRAVADVKRGEVDTATVFSFHEHNGVVWAEYGGGAITKGFLVGTRHGDQLDFRYAQLNSAGETSTGHSSDLITILDDGRLRLNERWEWESKRGTGTSILEERR